MDHDAKDLQGLRIRRNDRVGRIHGLKNRTVRLYEQTLDGKLTKDLRNNNVAVFWLK